MDIDYSDRQTDRYTLARGGKHLSSCAAIHADETKEKKDAAQARQLSHQKRMDIAPESWESGFVPGYTLIG